MDSIQAEEIRWQVSHFLFIFTCNSLYWLTLQGCYKVTPEGYAQMTHMLRGVANGRMVVALEVSAQDCGCVQ